MRRIFGVPKKPAEPGPPPPSLTQASETIDKRVGLIDEKIRQCDEELKKYKSQMTGPNATAVKNRAMTVLKRKKMYEAQRDQMLNTQFNVDQANFATENLKVTAITVDALKAGAAAIKTEYAKLNINSIEATMEDMEDLMYDQQEMNEILGRNYAVPDGFDEAALEGEFAMLEEEVALERMSGNAVPSYIPDTLPGQSAGAVPAASAPVDPLMDASAPPK
jgi:charged multivesicular body protein 5